MIYYQVLSEETKKILPIFKIIKKDFYLAGGTGLALQLGHRKSYDLDFFNGKYFSSSNLFQKIQKSSKFKILKKLQDECALFLEINNIDVNFLFYKYSLIKKPIETKYLNIAHFIDIACMKLLTITERIEYRDYVDLYFVLQKVSLKTLLKYFQNKISDIDPMFVLKCLIKTKEVEEENLEFLKNTKT